MPLVKTKALVLKRMNYSDSSRIMVLLCEDLGKLSVIHKGSRRRSGSGYIPGFGIIETLISVKPNRELQMVTQFTNLRYFEFIQTDLDRLRCAFIAWEILQRCIPSGSPVRPVYELAEGLLIKLNDASTCPDTELLRFLIGMAAYMGIVPEAGSDGFETLFERTGFNLDKDEFSSINSLMNSSNGVIDRKHALRISRIVENRLLEYSSTSTLQKARRVFEQL